MRRSPCLSGCIQYIFVPHAYAIHINTQYPTSIRIVVFMIVIGWNTTQTCKIYTNVIILHLSPINFIRVSCKPVTLNKQRKFYSLQIKNISIIFTIFKKIDSLIKDYIPITNTKMHYAITCRAILKNGPNKGSRCCKAAKAFGDMCGIHERLSPYPIHHPYNLTRFARENFASQITSLVIKYYFMNVKLMVSPGQYPEIGDPNIIMCILYQKALGRRLWYSIRKIQRAYREHLGRRRMKMIQQVLLPIIIRNK